MPAEPSPAFQFYVRDWLGDARVRAMTREARGVYMDLLCYCWQEVTLTGDIPSLARLAGMSTAAFRRLWPQLEPCFRPNSDGTYRHKRLDEERETQAEYREKQSGRGKKGAEARWRGHNGSITSALVSMCADDATGMLPDGSASASAYKNPPNPPEGGRVTKRDLDKAAELRRKSFGRCPHEIEHTYDECLRQIVFEQRAKVSA